MKNKKLITIVSALTILSFIIGFSYAYFTTVIIGNDTASTHKVTTGKMELTYVGTNELAMENVIPDTTKTVTFTVQNTGTVPITSYKVNLSNVINTLAVPEEMVYTLTCNSDDATPCNGVTETMVPKTTGTVLTQTSIAPNTTHTYTLTVKFKETGSLQDYNQGKILSFKITIDELKDFGTLVRRQAYDSTELFWEHAANISEVTFDNTINIPKEAVQSWDVSSTQDKSIMAYIVDDGLGTNTYHLHIQSNNDMIYANPDMSSWFSFIDVNNDMSKLTKINNLSLLNTTNVTSMSSMFSGCSGLTNLNLSTNALTQVTSYTDMFKEITSGINIVVKDETSKLWIETRLNETSVTGNVTVV